MANTLETLLVRVEGDISDLRRDLTEAEREATKSAGRMQKTFDRMTTAGRRLGTVGRNLTIGLTAPIVGVGAAAIRAAGQFEQSMNRVRAISGATGDDINKLRDLAKDLGETTQFSASEAADGMGFLAQAGFETNQILAALPGTLELAAAGQLSLAEASDLASNVLTGFGLEAREIGRVNDTLAKTASTANTDVRQLGEAMGFAAPVAAGFGVSVEESSAAVGLLSNAGIQASRAGTGFARILSILSQQADTLGVEVFDASGEMLPFADILEQLEESGLTASEAMQVFGQRGGPAMQALLSQGSDALRAMNEELENAEGTSKRMAESQMAGLFGQLKQLRSALEGAAIALGDTGLLSDVTSMAQGLTGLIRRVNDMDEGTQRLIVRFTLAAAALGPLTLGLGKLLTVAPKIVTAIRAIRTAMLFMGPAGLVVGAVGILASLGVAFAGRNDSLKEKVEEATGALDEAKDAIGSASDTDSLAGALDDLSGQLTGKASEAAERYAEQVRGMKGDIDEAAGAAEGFIQKLQALELQEQLREVRDAIREAEQLAGESVHSQVAEAGRGLAIAGPQESERIEATRALDELAREEARLVEAIEALVSGGGLGSGGGREGDAAPPAGETEPPPPPAGETEPPPGGDGDDERTVASILADLASRGTIAEQRAAALGTTDAQVDSLQARIRLLDGALTDMLEIGAPDGVIAGIVQRLQARERTLRVLERDSTLGGAAGQLQGAPGEPGRVAFGTDTAALLRDRGGGGLSDVGLFQPVDEAIIAQARATVEQVARDIRSREGVVDFGLAREAFGLGVVPDEGPTVEAFISERRRDALEAAAEDTRVAFNDFTATIIAGERPLTTFELTMLAAEEDTRHRFNDFTSKIGDAAVATDSAGSALEEAAAGARERIARIGRDVRTREGVVDFDLARDAFAPGVVPDEGGPSVGAFQSQRLRDTLDAAAEDTRHAFNDFTETIAEGGRPLTTFQITMLAAEADTRHAFNDFTGGVAAAAVASDTAARSLEDVAEAARARVRELARDIRTREGAVDLGVARQAFDPRVFPREESQLESFGITEPEEITQTRHERGFSPEERGDLAEDVIKANQAAAKIERDAADAFAEKVINAGGSLAGIITGLASGDMSAGGAISGIGGTIGSLVPGPWGAAISVGSGVLGGIFDAIGGSPAEEESAAASRRNRPTAMEFHAEFHQTNQFGAFSDPQTQFGLREHGLDLLDLMEERMKRVVRETGVGARLTALEQRTGLA